MRSGCWLRPPAAGRGYRSARRRHAPGSAARSSLLTGAAAPGAVCPILPQIVPAFQVVSASVLDGPANVRPAPAPLTAVPGIALASQVSGRPRRADRPLRKPHSGRRAPSPESAPSVIRRSFHRAAISQHHRLEMNRPR
ncbi:hypothetical protein AMJ39_09345, partial [candidate division TA06 bacterium DG_24]